MRPQLLEAGDSALLRDYEVISEFGIRISFIVISRIFLYGLEQRHWRSNDDEYRFRVVFKSVCPSCSWTVLISAPLWRRCSEWVPFKVWHEMFFLNVGFLACYLNVFLKRCWGWIWCLCFPLFVNLATNDYEGKENANSRHLLRSGIFLARASYVYTPEKPCHLCLDDSNPADFLLLLFDSGEKPGAIVTMRFLPPFLAIHVDLYA